MRLFAIAVSLTVLFCSALVSASQCQLPFDIQQYSNIDVTDCFKGCTASLHYTCDKLQGTNKWTKVTLPEQIAKGAATSFHLKVNEISGTSEVKFTVMEDAILRWTNNGQTATWVYWTGRFNTVGPSKVLPGSGPHAVTIIRCPHGLTIFEDGEPVGDKVPKPRETFVPTYHMQSLTEGSSLDIEVTELSVMDGIGLQKAGTVV